MTLPPRTVTAARYVMALREGSSLPALIEASDDGMYVVKFRAAGQGLKALVAELVAGELARLLELPVPEIVFVSLDPGLASAHPEALIRNLVHASAGVNLGLDYLPGSVMFGKTSLRPDATLASRIFWFDAFVGNPDRTSRNPNLLAWHEKLWLIDHGAALSFHHQWNGFLDRAARPYAPARNHLLLPFATKLDEADADMSERLTERALNAVMALIPDDWLMEDPLFADADAQRRAYTEYFSQRLQGPRTFLDEEVRGHAARI